MDERTTWSPVASSEQLRGRAELLSRIRAFFQQARVLEVETPALSWSAATDPAIDSLSTRYHGPAAPPDGLLYLHTSPEFAMKRLLAAGSGPIYQICKVFRDRESGRYHNPEFTLLEWYRPQYDHHRLMEEVELLLQSLMPVPRPVCRISYRALFLKYLNIDPFTASLEALRSLALDLGIPADMGLTGRDPWLDLLLSHSIQPVLAGTGICFVYDYPASQAALARVTQTDPPLAERFECFLDGVELANGFHELIDAAEQRRRFRSELEARRKTGGKQPPMDRRLLAALESGLPDCAGVALGLDRLLMCISGADHIDQVLAFPLERA